MGWTSSQQTHCAASALRELNVAHSEVLHCVNWGGGGGGGRCHIHTTTITLISKVLSLAVYYSNQSSVQMRPDVICVTRGGICRMGCANDFSGLRPHCSPLLVDVISCSCKARQARASSKCSWSGCHTASAGTMKEYVLHYHRNSQRGDTTWSRGWFIAGWKEWWQRA